MGVVAASLSGADKPKKNKKRKGDQTKLVDAKNLETGKPPRPRDPELEQYGIYAKTAARAETTEPIVTELPLRLNKGDRIALIGNTLFERSQFFGYFESLLHQQFPEHQLVVRNLAWSADTPAEPTAAGKFCRSRTTSKARTDRRHLRGVWLQ